MRPGIGEDKTMIEVKATATVSMGSHGESTADVDVKTNINGTGAEIIHETVAMIRSLMGQLADQSPVIHTAILDIIANDSSILLGKKNAEAFDDFRNMSENEKMLANLMSKAIVKEGVN